MQGLNPLTMQCTYLTPCGWCTKWDKKCDKKIGNNDDRPKRGLRAKCNFIYDTADVQADISKLKLSNSPCAECEHNGHNLPKCITCHENNYVYFKFKENNK